MDGPHLLLLVSLAFMAVALAGYALILVDAFRTDASQGLLCLFFPFYFLYFALARSRHPRRRVLVAVVVGAYLVAAPALYLAQRGGAELDERSPDPTPAGSAS